MDLRDRYAGLIFDCDGTLTDSMPLHYVAWRATMARYGIDFSEQQFYALGGMPTDQIIELLASENGVKVDVKTAATEKENAFFELIPDLQPKPEICEIVRQNLGAIPMAVASGGEREGVTLQLQHIGLADAFDTIVTAEDTERHKPEPDVFLHAAKLLAVDPRVCLVYEDSPLGFEAARAAGMDFVDVR